MILFVCPEPTSNNERDGLIQRVSAIDAKFQTTIRTILSVSFTRNLRRTAVRRSETLTVECVNAFIHIPHILRLARKSSAVYVHTCNQAFRVLLLYALQRNVITDMHGALPEEIAMQGLRLAKLRYDLIERFVVRRSSVLICVTSAMREHFVRKYPGLNARFFLLPILPAMAPEEEGDHRESNLALYCGGAQTWQCIPDLLMSIKQTSGFRRWLILTGDKERMRQEADAVGAVAEILSVPKTTLPKYYARAMYGFALRYDNVVNRVACPTKVVEYMYYGVIPVVKTPQIGDFCELGYQYIQLADFVAGISVESDVAEEMRQRNRNIVLELQSASTKEFRKLREFLENPEGGFTERSG